MKQNRELLIELIEHTNDNMLIWTYINSTTDRSRRKRDVTRHIFMAGQNLHYTKYLVIEMNMYEEPHHNYIEIYIQSTKDTYKTPIKEIPGGSKTLELSYSILNNIKSYNVDENFDEIYDTLHDKYKRRLLL